jgi:hypothetical protein
VQKKKAPKRINKKGHTNASILKHVNNKPGLVAQNSLAQNYAEERGKHDIFADAQENLAANAQAMHSAEILAHDTTVVADGTLVQNIDNFPAAPTTHSVFPAVIGGSVA